MTSSVRFRMEAVIASPAEEILGVLVRRATRHRDPRRRSVELAYLDRALADPRRGYLRLLRQHRTAALVARVAAGETTTALAIEAGVSARRMRALLAGGADAVTPEQRAARQERQASRAADRAAARERLTAARLEERKTARAREVERKRWERVELGRPLLARVAAGETPSALAAELNISRQKVTAWINDADDAQEALAAQALVMDGGA